MLLPVSFVYATAAENGAAGSVELKVEMGHEFTGQGMTFSPGGSPPQQGLSAHAYRTPVSRKWAVQFWQYLPWSCSGGGHAVGEPWRSRPAPQPIGMATGACGCGCSGQWSAAAAVSG